MIISWNTTKECNLYCKHCYRESGPDKKLANELSTEEGKTLIDEIAKAGFKILILSGGEPLLRKDIFDLAKYASSKGLIPALGTNGTLITKDVVKKIKESNIHAVAISLDSLNPIKHDEFRQTEDAFKKTVEGIKNCLEEGIRVQINPTVTRNNIDEIIDLIEHVSKLGVNSCHPFFLVEVGRGKNIDSVGLNKEEYKDILNKILDKQKDVSIELKPTCAPQFMHLAKEKGMNMRFSRGCIAGIKYCCILPNGDVHVCPYLPIKVGNVKELPFNAIWQNSKVFNLLRDYKNYEGNCGKCEDINICGGCRARAFSETQNYLSEDSFCLKEDFDV